MLYNFHLGILPAGIVVGAGLGGYYFYFIFLEYGSSSSPFPAASVAFLCSVISNALRFSTKTFLHIFLCLFIAYSLNLLPQSSQPISFPTSPYSSGYSELLFAPA